MDVHYLSSDFFDVLAWKVPKLESLDLAYSWLQCKDVRLLDPDRHFRSLFAARHDILRETFQDFLKNIARNDYSLCSVHNLRLCPREMQVGDDEDVRKFLASYLPDIRFINGIPSLKLFQRYAADTYNSSLFFAHSENDRRDGNELFAQ